MGKSSLTNVTIPAYSGNYTKGRSAKISEITIHHMAGVMTAEACGKLWQKVGRKGSSHYGIGNDGRIANYLDESNTAWTNSHWASNCRAVTIETSNNKTGGDWTVSNAALNSLIKLVADIAKRNGLGKLVKGKNLTWHSMYAATTCPGNYLRSKLDYIVDEANKINQGKEPTPVQDTFLPARGYFIKGDRGENVSKLATFMRKTFPSYTSAKALGPIYGDNLIKAIKEFQRRTGLKVDGSVGPATLNMLKRYGFSY